MLTVKGVDMLSFIKEIHTKPQGQFISKLNQPYLRLFKVINTLVLFLSSGFLSSFKAVNAGFKSQLRMNCHILN